MKSNDLLRILMEAGWIIYKQGKGSPIKLRHPRYCDRQIIFPDHGSREFAKGLENKILKQAGLK